MVSEPIYHTTKAFWKTLIATEMKKYIYIYIFMNKPVLGLSISEISKIVMYEFWYGYVIPKYNKKANLCYMDTDIFIAYVKTVYIYKGIVKDVERRFDSSN